jgi:hypothetical protein
MAVSSWTGTLVGGTALDSTIPVTRHHTTSSLLLPCLGHHNLVSNKRVEAVKLRQTLPNLVQHNTMILESRGSSVSIETRLFAGCAGFDSMKGSDFFCHRCVQTNSGAHPASYPMDAAGFYHGA